MLHRTKGIVLRTTRFGETSVIVNIFTDLFGVQGYLINGVRKSSGKREMALYQPLTLLDLIVYHKEHGGIMRIKEKRCLHVYRTLPHDMRKSAIAIFLNEILNKTLREEHNPSDLFQYIMDSLLSLDSATQFGNFHLAFLLQYAGYLGFGIADVTELEPDASFTEEELEKVSQLIKGDHIRVNMNSTERRKALTLILQFYHTHIRDLGELKSIPVLREVLS